MPNLPRSHRAPSIRSVGVIYEIGFAQEVADRIAVMDAGRIVESGTPEMLLQNPRTERARVFPRNVWK